MLVVFWHATLARGMDNGLALLPPMGWRSWNAFYADIDERKMRAQIDALARPRGSRGESLLSLGYSSMGIDEGWEGCGLGVNGTVHYANGTPTVDPKRFPNMSGLVAYGHGKGLRMGFYLNGCGCNEKVEKVINYEGDVAATVGWGFDAVKIDSCGQQRNMTRYGALFNATGVPIEIENCHQGQNFTDGGNPDQMGHDWCPYNFFRTSNDIVNLWDRVMENLLTVVPFLEEPLGGGRPISRPGCWAYPDMLEVGRMPEHNEAESRSHFSAWAVVSAPLVLGFDLTDEAQMNLAWPVVSNREVIAISQTWVDGASHASGRLLRRWQANNAPTLSVRGDCDGKACEDSDPHCGELVAQRQCILNPDYMGHHCRKSCGMCMSGSFTGFVYDVDTGSLRHGDLCVDALGTLPKGHLGGNEMHLLPCEPQKPSQRVVLTSDGRLLLGKDCLVVFQSWLWSHPIVRLGACPSGKPPDAMAVWALQPNGTLRNGKFGCIEVSTNSGPPSTIWAKPLHGGRVALLAINGADLPQTVELDLVDLITAARWEARDVWGAKDLGVVDRVSRTLAPHDCLLLVLSPALLLV